MTAAEPGAPAPFVVGVQVGPIASLGPGRVRSAFVKRPVQGPIAVTGIGLAGDAQADRSVHGGADKAVYGYPVESYDVWHATHPRHAARWCAGGVGENLTVSGLREDTVCIGDTMRIGDAVLQVTQPRQPCFKFALCFDDPTLPGAMIRNGLSGWYYRLLEPGTIQTGDDIALLDRPNPAWPITRMHRLIHARSIPPVERAELAALAGLAGTWAARLAS